MIGKRVKFTMSSDKTTPVLEGIVRDKVRDWYCQGGTGMTNVDVYVIETDGAEVVLVYPTRIKKIIRD